MILGIILIILFLKGFNKMYRKAVAHNAKLFGNYLFEIIRTARG